MTCSKDVDDNSYVNIPRIPVGHMWEGIARDIIMWMELNADLTPRSLIAHLKESVPSELPAWLLEEPEMRFMDSTLSKGTRATLIYRAMVEAHLEKTPYPHDKTTEKPPMENIDKEAKVTAHLKFIAVDLHYKFKTDFPYMYASFVKGDNKIKMQWSMMSPDIHYWTNFEIDQDVLEAAANSEGEDFDGWTVIN